MAQQEKDPDSILNYYRKLLKVRKENPIIIYGDYEEHYHESNEIYCYERNFNGQKALIVCSFADHTITFRAPKGFDLTKAKYLFQTTTTLRQKRHMRFTSVRSESIPL